MSYCELKFYTSVMFNGKAIVTAPDGIISIFNSQVPRFNDSFIGVSPIMIRRFFVISTNMSVYFRHLPIHGNSPSLFDQRLRSQNLFGLSRLEFLNHIPCINTENISAYIHMVHGLLPIRTSASTLWMISSIVIRTHFTKSPAESPPAQHHLRGCTF